MAQPTSFNQFGVPEDRRVALWLIIGFACLRVVFAAYLGLGVDEAYAVSISRELSWGYFDHPPMTFWLAHGAAYLFGSEAHLVVRAPFLLLGIASSLLLYALTERMFGFRPALWALSAWCIAPFFQISAASWIVPDGPLIFFLLLTAWLTWPLLEEPPVEDNLISPKGDGLKMSRWIWIGVALGGALLSKYHGFLFAGGAFLLLATSPQGRAWLKTPWPYFAGLLAVAMFLPVINWNASQGWPSFSFHASRAGDGASWTDGLFNGSRMVAGQLLYLLPVTFALGCWAAWRSFRRGPGETAAWFCLCLGAPTFLAFNLIAFVSDRSLPHWPLPGFLFFLPLLGLWVAAYAEKKPKTTLWSFVGGGAFTTLAMGILVIQSANGTLTAPFFESPQKWDDTTEIADWTPLLTAQEAGELVPNGSQLLARNWVEAAKISYALGGQTPIWVVDRDRRHFQFLTNQFPEKGASATLIYLVKPGRGDNVYAKALAGELPGFCGREALSAVPWRRGGVDYAHFGRVSGHIC